LYRGINEFKKGYQPRINIIKDENGNLLVHELCVLNRWENVSNKVLNIQGVHEVWQMDERTARPLLSEPSLVGLEIAIGKLRRYNCAGTYQILDELIKPGGEIPRSVIHRLME
jgi:hypothetical protein